MKEFNRINREIVYKGAIIDFCKDTIITPKNHTVKWDLIKHKGAAAIIPVTNYGETVEKCSRQVFIGNSGRRFRWSK